MQTFDSIASQQGWNAASRETILRGFIATQGLSDELDRYASEVARFENGGDED